jgi:hypothetical protein
MAEPQLTFFIYFPELPIEIRHEIFDLEMRTPRIVRVHFKKGDDAHLVDEVLALLHVCKKSGR